MPQSDDEFMHEARRRGVAKAVDPDNFDRSPEGVDKSLAGVSDDEVAEVDRAVRKARFSAFRNRQG